MSEHPPPQEARWPEDVIFTLGHSTLPIEAFLALLQAYGIERLVDIRTIPRSRHWLKSRPIMSGGSPAA
jgi:uncharacterized protein (DUF488 family)